MESLFDADVVVIGGGPSGATVAAEVAGRGTKVIVLEKRTGDSPSRAGIIQPRVLELLDARGLMGKFREKAREWRTDFEVPVYFYAGMPGLRYHELDSAHPYALILPQTTTEHLLRDWARENGVDIRSGDTYERHEQDDAGVTVHGINQEGAAFTLRTRYLVGADGAHSKVRKSEGVPFEGRGTELTGVTVDAVLPWPFPGPVHLARNEHGWVLAYPFGKETTRFIVVAEASRHVPLTVAPTMDEVRTNLRAIAGDDFGITEHRWLSRYGDAHRRTPYLVSGRVCLVGEATRVHYPASGMGMNYCIQDAFNLGWKLAFVVAGHAPEALLETYNEERHPVLRAMMDDVETQTTLHFNFTRGGLELKRFFEEVAMPTPEVNAAIRDRVSGLGTSYHRDADSHSADGTRLRQFDLGQTTYNEVARRSDFVLIEMADSAPHDRNLEGRITRVLATTPTFPANIAGTTTVLVRPDAYVARAWTSPPTDAEIAAAYGISTARDAAKIKAAAK